MSKSKWIVLSSDASGVPAIYARRIDDTTYAVCEVNFWESLDWSAVATHGKYNVQSGTVDLRSANAESALCACGFQVDGAGALRNNYDGSHVADAKDPAWIGIHVECLWRYGAKEVVCDVSGNNLRRLLKIARQAV